MKVAQKPRRTDGCADQAWLDAGAGAQPALRRWPPCSISRGFHDLRVIVPVWCCRSAAFQRFPTAAKIALVARNSSALDAMVPLPSLTGTVVMQHNRSVKIRSSHPATTVFISGQLRCREPNNGCLRFVGGWSYHRSRTANFREWNVWLTLTAIVLAAAIHFNVLAIAVQHFD